VRDRKAQNEAVDLLTKFERVAMAAEDFDRAIEQALRFRLSHGVDIMDCLIAAPCRRLEATLMTRNLKHFSVLLGDLVERPY
jgi:predicted nucleic acid-binding protein